MQDNKARVAALLGVILAATISWTACGPSAQQPQETTPKGSSTQGGPTRYKVEAAKQTGGRLVMPLSTAFGNPNDPHLPATATGRSYAVPVTNGLLKGNVYDKDYSIVGDLAKSWEVSKDGLSYTFKLQQGVKFQNVPPVNGREFTSEDAKYSLLRTTADPSIVIDKWKPRFQRALDFGDVKNIETPDKYTLVVSLKEPYAPFLDAVANPGTAILPREFVEKFPEKIITEGMVGTGPYLPVEYKNQQLATYKKNPDYWKKDSQGAQLPYLAELSFLYFADMQAELAAFRSRQIDVTRSSLDLSADVIKPMMTDNPSIQVFTTTSTSLTNFRFNMKFKPFQDINVRRAMHLAIDRQQFVEIISRGAGVVAGPVTPTYPSLANTTDWLLSQPGFRKDKTQDIEEAKRLMKEAGYADGFAVQAMISVSASTSSSSDLAALFQDQMKTLKITVKPDMVDYAGKWVPRSTQGEFELSEVSHALANDADALLSPHFLTGAPRNYGKFSDPVLDDMIKKQRSAVSVEERRKWAQDAEKRLLDQLPMLFLYNPSNTMLAQSWVHNAGDGPFSGTNAYLVEQAWVENH